jgi:uncharacterized Zn-binding protein involved in type VI secretion
MPAAARIGDPFSTGHACDGASTIAAGSGDVFANSIGVSRLGDASVAHAILVGDVCVPHVVPIAAGSGSVFVNGIACARVGDAIDAGAITAGSGDVFAGG